MATVGYFPGSMTSPVSSASGHVTGAADGDGLQGIVPPGHKSLMTLG